MEQISVTNTHKLQVAPELCIKTQLRGSVGPALIAAMARIICHCSGRVGWREGGGASTLGGLAWVRALSHHPRKPWSWLKGKVGSAFTHQEEETKLGGAFFPCWQPLIRGEPLVSQPEGQAAPLTAGAGRFPLCIVAGFDKSLFHFQRSPEELIRETTMFLLLVALNDPQNANKERAAAV